MHYNMKTEFQKMLDGELYNAADNELVNSRLQARRLFSKYNQTLHENMEERNAIMKELLGSMGNNIDIMDQIFFWVTTCL